MSNLPEKVDIFTLNQLDQFTRQFAKKCPNDAWVYLHGDLGSGKTTFTQHFIKNKGYSGLVTSPTYALMNEYDTLTGNIAHCDFYRLSEPEELYEIGILSFSLPTIKIIEWPERGKGVLPKADIEFNFFLCQTSRHIEIRTY